jgi:hypothetical protein
MPLTGVSISTIASIATPLFTALGIKTGKRRIESVRRPVGQVIVAVLCSLARHGQEVQKVHQGRDGCVIEAVLPSDLWSFAGELVVSVAATEEGAQVEAGTKIGGQLFDWGKSRRCLDQLFTDIHRN